VTSSHLWHLIPETETHFLITTTPVKNPYPFSKAFFRQECKETRNWIPVLLNAKLWYLALL